MLTEGKAVKITIYLSEGATHHRIPTYSSVLDFLFFHGVCGATVLKGIAGFGIEHHLHTASLVEVSDHLPLLVQFIESREKVDELLGKLKELVGSAMIEMEETTILKAPEAHKN